jgi:hypothetical protein
MLKAKSKAGTPPKLIEFLMMATQALSFQLSAFSSQLSAFSFQLLAAS